MKTFIEPDFSTEGTEAFEGGGETENMPTGKELETTALTPPINIDKQPTPPPESNGSPLPSKPTCVGRPPEWVSDFVSSNSNSLIIYF